MSTSAYSYIISAAQQRWRRNDGVEMSANANLRYFHRTRVAYMNSNFAVHPPRIW